MEMAVPTPIHHPASLSVDDVLMGEILMSLKRGSAVNHDATSDVAHWGVTGYRSKVDLTVTPPSVEDASAAMDTQFTTVSPVASSLYHTPMHITPTHSPTERTKRYGPVVQLEDLRKCFNMPIAAVARKFGICATLLKKICRRHGIQRWPHRQIRSLQKSIDMLRESLAVAKGSNKDYISKKIAAFEYTLQCIMQDPNTAAKGISAGRLASPATEELVKRGNRAKNRKKVISSSTLSTLSDDDDIEEEDSTPWRPAQQLVEDRKVGMSLQSILC